jgi:hypothetical protein
VSHFEKLGKADADERHLFIPLHDSALPFSISSELVFEDTLPPDPPPVPESVTHPVASARGLSAGTFVEPRHRLA